MFPFEGEESFPFEGEELFPFEEEELFPFEDSQKEGGLLEAFPFEGFEEAYSFPVELKS